MIAHFFVIVAVASVALVNCSAFDTNLANHYLPVTHVFYGDTLGVALGVALKPQFIIQGLCLQEFQFRHVHSKSTL